MPHARNIRIPVCKVASSTVRGPSPPIIVRVEGRDHVYKFDRYGYDKAQHGIAWQGGITYSF